MILLNYPYVIGKELTCDRAHPRFRWDTAAVLWLEWLVMPCIYFLCTTTCRQCLCKFPQPELFTRSIKWTDFRDLTCPYMYSNEVSVSQAVLTWANWGKTHTQSPTDAPNILVVFSNRCSTWYIYPLLYYTTCTDRLHVDTYKMPSKYVIRLLVQSTRQRTEIIRDRTHIPFHASSTSKKIKLIFRLVNKRNK